MSSKTKAGESTETEDFTTEIEAALPGGDLTPSDCLSEVIHHELNPVAGVWIVNKWDFPEYSNNDTNARLYDVGVDGFLVIVWDNPGYTFYTVVREEDAEEQLQGAVKDHLDDLPCDGPNHQWIFRARGEIGTAVADDLVDRLDKINETARNA